jgi:hypothetical protein
MGQSSKDLYPMNNTVDDTVREYTTDVKKQKVKKQKIKKSTIKQLRTEAKKVKRGLNDESN